MNATEQLEQTLLTELDRRIERTGCFWIDREVRGEILQPRIGTERRSVRIDRILTPTSRLVNAGWTRGPIGIEGKRCEVALGKAVSQVLDYMRSAFLIATGHQVIIEWAFLFPFKVQSGDIGIVMLEHRIGTIGFLGERIMFDVGGKSIISIDGSNVPTVALPDACGRAGSRK